MVLCVVEHENGEVEDSSFEMLTLARDVASQLDTSMEAVVFGEGGDAIETDLGAYGVDTLHVVEHADLDGYAPAAWATSVSQVASHTDAETVIAPGTDRGHEVLAHAAAREGLSMAANCLEVTTGDAYEVTRQRWGGTLLEYARLSGETKLLTVAKNEISAEPGGDSAESAVESFEPSLSESDLSVRLDRVEESDEEGIPLGEARVVVGGGRGVGSAEDFDKLEALAEELDAAVGASRAAVNEGWRSHDSQIGQTGAKISPHLYIPCGISGAVQHMVGCKGTEHTLAINTDPEAAIVGHADYAVIADLHEVVPELTEVLQNRP